MKVLRCPEVGEMKMETFFFKANYFLNNFLPLKPDSCDSEIWHDLI